MGPGEIHLWVLRELAYVIVRLLSIFERSWWSGGAPEDWKKASVTHIHKKGKREESGTLKACQAYFDLWEGDAATNPENYFQTHEGQQGD